MSLRKLPEIKAFDGLSQFTFDPPDSVVAKWRPDIRSATEGDEGVISIYDVIGEDMWDGEGMTSKRIAGALRRIGNRDVTVNINSPGGDFFEGIGIYSLLREHPARVTVKVMGLAASAASVIAMAGDDIQISPVGFMMVHNAWAVAIGNRHDFRQAADTLEPFDDAMANLYAERSGAAKAEAVGWMDAETWFNGSGAIDAGLADSVMSEAEISEANRSGTQSLAAVRRVEAALAKQGMSRNERRSLIGELAGSPAVAGAQRSAVASEELEADIRSLIDKFRA